MTATNQDPERHALIVSIPATAGISFSPRVAIPLTVAEEHGIRTLLEQRLKVLPYQVWLNLDLLPMPHSSDRKFSGEPIRSS